MSKKSTDNISYSTTVKLEKYKINNDKSNNLIYSHITHNTGTWVLFNALCRSLAGVSNSTVIPRYLDVQNSSGISQLKTSVLPNKISYDLISANSGDWDSTPCNISYSFSLYADNINATGGTRFVLTNINGTRCAWVNIEIGEQGSGVFDLAVDEMLAITWVMTFGNAEEEDEEAIHD